MKKKKLKKLLTSKNAKILNLKQKLLKYGVSVPVIEDVVAKGVVSSAEKLTNASIHTEVSEHLSELFAIKFAIPRSNTDLLLESLSVLGHTSKAEHANTSSGCEIKGLCGEFSKLSSAEKREVLDDPKRLNGFSSRFMPNVKFRVPVALKDAFLEIHPIGDYAFNNKVFGYYTDCSGISFLDIKATIDPFASDYDYNHLPIIEVSIYEAIPELVPDGMIYDKESDSLINNELLEKEQKIKDDVKKPISEINSEIKALLKKGCIFSYPVKFIVPPVLLGSLLKNGVILNNKRGYCISKFLEIGHFPTKKGYLKSTWEEVSIYEAFPELVPSGMVYDAESDSLVGIIGQETLYIDGELKSKKILTQLDEVDFINDQIKVDPEKYEAMFAKMTQRIKPFPSAFAKELSKKYPFTASYAEAAIKAYGEELADSVLKLESAGLTVGGIPEVKNTEWTSENITPHFKHDSDGKAEEVEHFRYRTAAVNALLSKVQFLFWGTKYPILEMGNIGIKVNGRGKHATFTHTVSFTTGSEAKKAE